MNITFAIRILIFLTICTITKWDISCAQGFVTSKGKILDKTTGELLYDAYICIPSTGYGTAPNLDGNFLFQFPALSTDSVVVVSKLGYKSLFLNASSLSPDSNLVYLEPEIRPKSQFGKSNPAIILEQAIQNIKTNQPTSSYVQQGFYQEIVRLPSIGLIRLNEGVLKIERIHKEDSKEQKVKLMRGRRIELKNHVKKIEGWGFQNGTELLCRSLDIQLPDFLQKSSLNDYEYDLDSLMTIFEGKSLIGIRFKPKRKGLKGGKEGVVFLEPASQAIVRYEYKLSPSALKDQLSSKDGYVKITGKEATFIAQYREFNGRWYMQDSKAVFDVQFEDNLDYEFKIDAKIEMRYLSFENLPLPFSSIEPREILTSTNNFLGLNSVNSNYWVPFNYLLPTFEVEKLHEDLRNK
ncbi:MAG: hypothetical protein ACRCVT_08095 [Leadbetterella sp.]